MVETVNDQPAYKVSLRYCFETFEKKGNGTVEIWMKKFSKEDSSCHCDIVTWLIWYRPEPQLKVLPLPDSTANLWWGVDRPTEFNSELVYGPSLRSAELSTS